MILMTVVEADWTREEGLETFPALLDASATEVMATVDGHRVFEVIQTDGTADFSLQVFQGGCGGHCALRISAKGIFK